MLAVSAGIADTSSVEAVEAVKEKSSRDVAEKQLIKKKNSTLVSKPRKGEIQSPSNPINNKSADNVEFF